MGTLDGLKFVAAKRSSSISPVVARRNKLLKKIFEQEEVVKAEINGGAYSASKLKKMVDGEGNVKVIEVPKRVNRWFYAGDDGKLYLIIKYGNKLIEFTKGKQAIEVGDKAGLLKALAIIKTAVAEGELDAQITNLVGAVREGLR